MLTTSGLCDRVQGGGGGRGERCGEGEVAGVVDMAAGFDDVCLGASGAGA